MKDILLKTYSHYIIIWGDVNLFYSLSVIHNEQSALGVTDAARKSVLK